MIGFERDAWVAVGLIVMIAILAAILDMWWLVIICIAVVGWCAFVIGYSRGAEAISHFRDQDFEEAVAKADHPSNGRRMRMVRGGRDG